MRVVREEYDLGDRTKLTGVFTAEGVPADPSEVKFQIRRRSDPEFTEYVYVEPSVVVKRSDVGVYYVVWTWSDPGVWYYRFVGSGSIGAAIEGSAFVKPSPTIDKGAMNTVS